MIYLIKTGGVYLRAKSESIANAIVVDFKSIGKQAEALRIEDSRLVPCIEYPLVGTWAKAEGK